MRKQIKPRPYQVEGLTAIEAALARGVTRQLVELPTGSGKTILFSELIRRREGRALILAHRDELISQAYHKVKAAMPEGTYVGIVKAEENQLWATIVVASVQTLSMPNRLRNLHPSFNTVIVDEAHHSTGASYRRILDYVKTPLLVGFTATIDRADGVGLHSVFDEIVFRKTLPDMVNEGWLVPVRAVQVKLAVDLDGLEVRNGDFGDRQLVSVLEAANAPELVARAVLEHAADRKSLIFTPGVEVAYDIANECRAVGFRAEAVHGDTDIDDRRRILRQLKSGEIQVLANCGVLLEGFDEPSINCVVMARPTKSRSLYTQVVGRGLRLHDNKTECLVIDLVGVSDLLELVTAASIFGRKPPEPREPKAPAEEDDDGESEEPEDTRPRLDGVLVAKEIELFKDWLPLGPNRFAINLGREGSIVVQSHADGLCDVAIGGEILAESVTPETAAAIGRDYAEHTGAPRAFTDRNAAWRSRPATAEQIDRLLRWNMHPKTGLTAGEASDIITRRIDASRSQGSKARR